MWLRKLTLEEALRRTWQRKVEADEVVCARCGVPIEPFEEWISGTSTETSRYAGPEHRRCNRATAGRLRMRWSRQW